MSHADDVHSNPSSNPSLERILAARWSRTRSATVAIRRRDGAVIGA